MGDKIAESGDLAGFVQKGRRGWEWWILRLTTNRTVYEGWEATKRDAAMRVRELCK